MISSTSIQRERPNSMDSLEVANLSMAQESFFSILSTFDLSAEQQDLKFEAPPNNSNSDLIIDNKDKEMPNLMEYQIKEKQSGMQITDKV